MTKFITNIVMLIGLLVSATVFPSVAHAIEPLKAQSYVIHEKPVAPVFVDECGYMSDSFSYQDGHSGQWEWQVDLLTSPEGYFEVVTLKAVAIEPYKFKTPDKKRTWQFVYTNDAECTVGPIVDNIKPIPTRE